MQKLLRIIPRGSMVLAATTLGSYILGLYRDRIFAHTFGASRALDAYNAAFLLPDFLFNVVVASGVAAAFVPIFLELIHVRKEKAVEYTNTVLAAAISAMAIAGIFLAVFAGPASGLVAPGFGGSDRALVAKLLRIAALSPILFAASNTLGSLLVAERRFLFYGLSPMLYNLGIIGGALFLAPSFGVFGVALGTLGGALLHFAIRATDAYRWGFRFRPNFKVRTAEFRRTLRLMLPKMLGHPVELATFWGFTIIASGLVPGSVAVLNFARNFQSVPVSLIGITIATATFPLLAHAVTDGKPDEFRARLKRSFWLIFFGSVAASAILFAIREPLIRLVLGGRAFSDADVLNTATALGVFTLAMPTEALVHLLARAFYATKNTTIPVALSILGFLIAISAAKLLAPTLGVFALPLAFFLGSATEMTLLMTLLPLRLRRITQPRS